MEPTTATATPPVATREASTPTEAPGQAQAGQPPSIIDEDRVFADLEWGLPEEDCR